MIKIEALKQAREHFWLARKEPVRLRCGISEAGATCPRYIWYSIRACFQEEMTADKIKFLLGGHRAEDFLLAEIKDVVHRISPAEGHQHKISIAETGNHLNGSCDGVGHFMGDYILIECKSVYDKSFKQIVKNTLVAERPLYIKQANLYIYGLNDADFIKKYQFLNGDAGSKKTVNEPSYNAQKITKTLFIIENRQTSEVYYEFVEHDEEQARQLIERFNIILRSSNPPAKLSENPSWFECRMCKYHSICHEDQVASTNCRTCKHSFPAKNAGWKCGLKNKLLTEDEQRQACDEHLFISSLIPATPVNVNANHQYIEYERNGKKFRNITRQLKNDGANFYSSELSTENSLNAVIDPFVIELKSEFPGMKLI